MLDSLLNQYINLQISQVFYVFYETKRWAPIVYITDSPAKLDTNINETALVPTMRGGGEETKGDRIDKRFETKCTYREFSEVNWEKFDGIGPWKEFPWNLLQNHLHFLWTWILIKAMLILLWIIIFNLNRKIDTHKEVSFVQFPMKAGIVPENGLSDAHLISNKLTYVRWGYE